MKIIDARWGGVDIEVIDVQVQGEPAPRQIVAALEQFNEMAEPPEVLVLIRGGGSAEDLAAFSTEQVTRAVAASRVPTLVAIGHEVDICLAELAADQRASTPSNAAELLTPDKQHELRVINDLRKQLDQLLTKQVSDRSEKLTAAVGQLQQAWQSLMSDIQREFQLKRQLLTAYDPNAALKRGYAIIRADDRPISSVKKLVKGQKITLQLQDGQRKAVVE
jgi:exodeoxyribonuclease VII large subunit